MGAMRAACWCALPGHGWRRRCQARREDSFDAGASARRRAHGRRRDELGRAQSAAPFPEGSPVFRPARAAGCDRVGAGHGATRSNSGRARHRSADRRHAAGHPQTIWAGQVVCSMSPPMPNGRPCRCRGCLCRCWNGWQSRPAAAPDAETGRHDWVPVRCLTASALAGRGALAGSRAKPGGGHSGPIAARAL